MTLKIQLSIQTKQNTFYFNMFYFMYTNNFEQKKRRDKKKNH